MNPELIKLALFRTLSAGSALQGAHLGLGQVTDYRLLEDIESDLEDALAAVRELKEDLND